jgi:integrase
MERFAFTDVKLRALPPATSGKRYEVGDALVPGLVVRVTDKGTKTLMLRARFANSPDPKRLEIGKLGEMTLAQARDTAREWLAMKEQGLHPGEERKRSLEAERSRRQVTFAVVAEEFIARHLRGKRKEDRSTREIRTELIPHWGERPITDIDRGDVVRLIEAIAARPAPYYARNILVHIQSLFGWALHRGIYGLEHSPTDRLKPSQLIGALPPRQRVLADQELAALWRAADQLGYPFGPLVRMLVLTGARLNEVAGASWREFDRDRKLWTVPAERFKSGSEHLVPLTDDTLALLSELPRWTKGDRLFSTTDGTKPVNGFSKTKARLDRLVAAELGDVPPGWVFHDIRRTFRTRLSGLRVAHEVAEMVIGHGRKGLARVYDQYTYVDEMREALEAWGSRLRLVVEPPPANVVPLRAGGRA